MKKSTHPSKKISYPYMHPRGSINYVPADNQFMLAARKTALKNSLDKTMPTGSAVVIDNQIIGLGANGSDYHEKHGCERVRLNIPTGQGYELCEGCSPKNHSEPRAIADARKKNKPTKGADLYLWGHWWCCEPCWVAMTESGIKNVYLMEGSEVLFNREVSGNIVGKQFD